jgi:hypothetical protein
VGRGERESSGAFEQFTYYKNIWDGAMSVSFRLFPEACIEKIVERAIEEGKLFELLFTEKGRQLWKGWREDQIRALVMQKLSIKFEKKKKQRRWQR